MNHYKCTIAYDGTNYFGWQKTQAGPSIQETIAVAILRCAQEQVLPEGASRTDRGVHAEGQTISFYLKKEWDATSLQRALNAALPPDIRVLRVEKISLDFHPTLHAVDKEYRYRICSKEVQEPFDRLYSWALYEMPDLQIMEKAASYFVGTHDFSALANEKKPNPICTLKHLKLTNFSHGELQISMLGDRFLYKMARNLVGTLVAVGLGKLSQENITQLLLSCDRTKAGITAPAHGLTLYRVNYFM